MTSFLFPQNIKFSKKSYNSRLKIQIRQIKSKVYKAFYKPMPTASPLINDVYKEPTKFDTSKTANFDTTEGTTTEKSDRLMNLIRKLPTASALVSSNNYVYEKPTEMSPKFRTTFDISKTTDVGIIDEISTEKSDKSTNFNEFEEYDESEAIQEPRSFEILKVGVEKEEELENQNNDDEVDYKSRSLNIFPRLINRRQKKPPKFVAIPLSKPRVETSRVTCGILNLLDNGRITCKS